MFLKSRRPECREYVGSTRAGGLLESSGLGAFEALWSLKAPWVERPNYRRRGWSGVCRLELQGAAGCDTGVYLKRQQGHCYRSARPPFGRRPTAYREYRHLARMATLAIGAPEVLYYGERRIDGIWQAALVTREIPQAVSLEAYLRQALGRPAAEVQTVLGMAACLISTFHRHHFMHGALYGKHVLLGRPRAAAPAPVLSPPRVAAFLIDLEKARRHPMRWRIAAHDLSQLYRHAPWQPWQWTFFLKRYLTESRAAGQGLFLARSIRGQSNRKIARHGGRSPIQPRPLPAGRSGG